MKRILLVVLVMIGVGAVACATPVLKTATAVPEAPPSLARKSGLIRFSIINEPNTKDIPRLMAIDTLRESGYSVEMTPFATTNLIPVALDRGDIDIGDATVNLAWTAITKGSDARSIVGEANITFYLITTQNIQNCRDMDGRAIGFSNRQSLGYLMFDDYISQNCAGTGPQIVLISDQNSRVASLLSGKVDGAYLEVESWLQVNSQAPGKFRIAIDYAKEFPQVQYSTFTVRRLWAQQNPEIVKDFIRALLNANRRLVGHPDVLQEEIVKYFPADASSAKNWAQIIGGLGVWEVNGSLTAQNVQSTVDYLASKGSFSATTKANDVSDLSYLNAVLDEIGRQ